MLLISNLAVALIALLHIYILCLEMFLWTKPVGLKAFRNSPQKAKETASLAANQGLYNGFLAAGLIWSLLHPEMTFAFQLKLFFLACVIIAGLYGAWSVHRKIFFIQTVPASIALVATFLSHFTYGG